MNVKHIPGLLIAGTGALLAVIGWAFMEDSDGFDGLAFGPVIYGGFFIFLFGIIKSIIQFKQSKLLTKIILIFIIVSIVIAMIVGNMITMRDSNRVKYCNQKYPYENYAQNVYYYNDNPNRKCINRQID